MNEMSINLLMMYMSIGPIHHWERITNLSLKNTIVTKVTIHISNYVVRNSFLMSITIKVLI